ncbi:unnamed protein product [Amoebophrya sp. A120]|nr:unnamed protein product [Amoebophrya sp. A120]|eukprot:GSA120T00018092001.1
MREKQLQKGKGKERAGFLGNLLVSDFSLPAFPSTAGKGAVSDGEQLDLVGADGKKKKRRFIWDMPPLPEGLDAEEIYQLEREFAVQLVGAATFKAMVEVDPNHARSDRARKFAEKRIIAALKRGDRPATSQQEADKKAFDDQVRALEAKGKGGGKGMITLPGRKRAYRRLSSLTAEEMQAAQRGDRSFFQTLPSGDVVSVAGDDRSESDGESLASSRSSASQVSRRSGSAPAETTRSRGGTEEVVGVDSMGNLVYARDRREAEARRKSKQKKRRSAGADTDMGEHVVNYTTSSPDKEKDATTDLVLPPMPGLERKKKVASEQKAGGSTSSSPTTRSDKPVPDGRMSKVIRHEDDAADDEDIAQPPQLGGLGLDPEEVVAIVPRSARSQVSTSSRRSKRSSDGGPRRGQYTLDTISEMPVDEEEDAKSEATVDEDTASSFGVSDSEESDVDGFWNTVTSPSKMTAKLRRSMSLRSQSSEELVQERAPPTSPAAGEDDDKANANNMKDVDTKKKNEGSRGSDETSPGAPGTTGPIGDKDEKASKAETEQTAADDNSKKDEQTKPKKSLKEKLIGAKNFAGFYLVKIPGVLIVKGILQDAGLWPSDEDAVKKPRKLKDLASRDLSLSTLSPRYFLDRMDTMKLLVALWFSFRVVYFAMFPLNFQFISTFFEPIYIKNYWDFDWDIIPPEYLFVPENYVEGDPSKRQTARVYYFLACMAMNFSGLYFPVVCGLRAIMDLLLITCIAQETGNANVELSGYKRKFSSLTDAKRAEREGKSAEANEDEEDDKKGGGLSSDESENEIEKENAKKSKQMEILAAGEQKPFKDRAKEALKRTLQTTKKLSRKYMKLFLKYSKLAARTLQEYKDFAGEKFSSTAVHYVKKFVIRGSDEQEKRSVPKVVSETDKIARIPLYLGDYRVYRSLMVMATVSCFVFLLMTMFAFSYSSTPEQRARAPPMERLVFAAAFAHLFAKGVKTRLEWSQQWVDPGARRYAIKVPGEFDILVGFFRERGTLLYKIDVRPFYLVCLCLGGRGFISVWRRPLGILDWNMYSVLIFIELLTDFAMAYALLSFYQNLVETWTTGNRRFIKLLHREKEKAERERVRHEQRLRYKRTTPDSFHSIFRSDHRSGAVRSIVYRFVGISKEFDKQNRYDYVLDEDERVHQPLLLEDVQITRQRAESSPEPSEVSRKSRRSRGKLRL